MKSHQLGSRGFTLIELLVVIAIIGLLASVVLAALATARQAARDATVRQQLRELAKVMEIQYLDTRNYQDLKPSAGNAAGTGSSSTCASAFSGTYATKAAEICDAIRSAQLAAGFSYNNVYVYVNASMAPAGSKFSVMARKPSNGNEFFCYGSSGGTYEGVSNPGSGNWTGPGCNANP